MGALLLQDRANLTSAALLVSIMEAIMAMMLEMAAMKSMLILVLMTFLAFLWTPTVNASNVLGSNENHLTVIFMWFV